MYCFVCVLWTVCYVSVSLTVLYVFCRLLVKLVPCLLFFIIKFRYNALPLVERRALLEYRA